QRPVTALHRHRRSPTPHGPGHRRCARHEIPQRRQTAHHGRHRRRLLCVHHHRRRIRQTHHRRRIPHPKPWRLRHQSGQPARGTRRTSRRRSRTGRFRSAGHHGIRERRTIRSRTSPHPRTRHHGRHLCLTREERPHRRCYAQLRN